MRWNIFDFVWNECCWDHRYFNSVFQFSESRILQQCLWTIDFLMPPRKSALKWQPLSTRREFSANYKLIHVHILIRNFSSSLSSDFQTFISRGLYEEMHFPFVSSSLFSFLFGSWYMISCSSSLLFQILTYVTHTGMIHLVVLDCLNWSPWFVLNHTQCCCSSSSESCSKQFLKIVCIVSGWKGLCVLSVFWVCFVVCFRL